MHSNKNIIFAAMFRMPKTLRWILLISVLLLVLMTAARLAVYYRFRVPVTGSDPVGPAMWLGFRFDFRLVAGLGLLVGLLGAFLTGLGVGWALPAALVILAVAGIITVGQRMALVHAQTKGAERASETR